MIDHRGRADEPGILDPGRIHALLCAKDVGLLLGLADEQDAFVPLELRQVLLGPVVFSFAFGKAHHVDALDLDEPLDRLHELQAHRSNHERRGHPAVELVAEEERESGPCLQRRDVTVQVHAVNAFKLQHDVIPDDFCDAFSYHGLGLPESAAHMANDPLRVQYLGAGFNLPCSTGPH